MQLKRWERIMSICCCPPQNDSRYTHTNASGVQSEYHEYDEKSSGKSVHHCAAFIHSATVRTIATFPHFIISLHCFALLLLHNSPQRAVAMSVSVSFNGLVQCLSCRCNRCVAALWVSHLNTCHKAHHYSCIYPHTYIQICIACSYTFALIALSAACSLGNFWPTQTHTHIRTLCPPCEVVGLGALAAVEKCRKVNSCCWCRNMCVRVLLPGDSVPFCCEASSFAAVLSTPFNSWVNTHGFV